MENAVMAIRFFSAGVAGAAATVAASFRKKPAEINGEERRRFMARRGRCAQPSRSDSDSRAEISFGESDFRPFLSRDFRPLKPTAASSPQPPKSALSALAEIVVDCGR